jgi:hypothetical protein
MPDIDELIRAEAFPLLAREGFTETRPDIRGTLQWKSECCTVLLCLQQGQLEMGLKPVGATRSYNLVFVMKALHPEAGFEYLPPQSFREDWLKRESNRLPSVALTYCIDILRGDSSKLSFVDEYQEQHGKRMKAFFQARMEQAREARKKAQDEKPS